MFTMLHNPMLVVKSQFELSQFELVVRYFA
jgi:hypothetical protein